MRLEINRNPKSLLLLLVIYLTTNLVGQITINPGSPISSCDNISFVVNVDYCDLDGTGSGGGGCYEEERCEILDWGQNRWQIFDATNLTTPTYTTGWIIDANNPHFSLNIAAGTIPPGNYVVQYELQNVDCDVVLVTQCPFGGAGGVYATCEGPDFMHQLNFSIIDMTVRDTITDYICQGKSYNFNGQILTNSGYYHDTISTTGGCDTIRTLNLINHPNSYTSINDQICYGDIYNFNGQNINTPGLYYDTLSTIYGCDSIITLNLIVNPIYRDTFSVIICSGQSYFFGGNTHNASGFFQSSFISISGCDSTEVLNLTVLPVLRDTIFQTICNGQSYSFAGNNYSLPGTYSDSLVNAHGCDSISTLVLSVNQLSYDTTLAFICQGDNYLFGGKNYNLSGQYHDTLINNEGCDSISTLVLIVSPNYHDSIYDTICEGSFYVFEGNPLTNSGIYFSSLVTSMGCDSLTTLFLEVIPIKRDSIFASICEEDSYLFAGTPRTVDGIYTETITLTNGCDSISTLLLTINTNPSIKIIGDTTICNNKLGLLAADEIFPFYLWNSGETTPSINYYKSGIYRLTVSDINNCQASDSINVSVINCEDTCQFFIPNTFTPNNDTYNDVFQVYTPSTCIYSNYQFRIFNRWGELIFESKDIEDNWDGKHNGYKVPTGTYIWVLNYRKDGQIINTQKIGHVNIIR